MDGALPLLTTSNISLATQAIASLVLFSAPHCTRSASLRAELLAVPWRSEAGRPLIAECEDIELADAAGARSLPALRLYSGSAEPEPFHGPLEGVALGSLLRRVGSAEPLFTSSAKEVRDEVDAVEAVAIGFAPPDSPLASTLRALAADTALRRRLSFILAPLALAEHFDPDALAAADARLDEELAAREHESPDAARPGRPQPHSTSTAPVLLLYRQFDEEVVRYPGDLASADVASGDLAEWLRWYSLPALAEIGPENYAAYESSSLPIFWLFVNSSAPPDSAASRANDALRDALREEAMPRRGAAHFVWLDGERYDNHLRSLAAPAGVLPALAADHNGAHFIFDGLAASDQHEIAAAGLDLLHEWVDAVVDGKLNPTLRSAPPPLDNFGPVVTVVAATLDELVYRSSADVLLLVHASWCEKCDVRRTRPRAAPMSQHVHRNVAQPADPRHRASLASQVLASEVASLALHWQDEKMLRVASFDVGANDLPNALAPNELPALLFFKAPADPAAPGEVAAGLADAPTPAPLSHLTTEAQIGAAMLQLSPSLRRPADASHVEEILGLLPKFSQEAQLLLQENERLRAELTQTRTQLRAARAGTRAPDEPSVQ